MKYLKHYFAQSRVPESSRRGRHSTFQTSNTRTKPRQSSFEDNLAESCFQTKKMIDDYELQVDAMKKKRRDRNGGYNVCNNNSNNNNNSTKRQLRDRYDVSYGGGAPRPRGPRHYGKPDILVHDNDDGDTDSLTDLTDDLTYLNVARKERANRIRKEAADGLYSSSRAGSANDPLDVTMMMYNNNNNNNHNSHFTSRREEQPQDRREDRNMHHPFNHREEQDTPRFAAATAGSASRNNNPRSGRFSTKSWKDSTRHRRSLLNNDDNDDGGDDDNDFGEQADEDRYNGGNSRNNRSGRFSTKSWRDSTSHRRSLLNDHNDDSDSDISDTDDDNDNDYGEQADEDWPGVRIPLIPPPRQQQQQKKKKRTAQSSSASVRARRRTTIMDKLHDFDAVLGETHRGENEQPESSSSSSVISIHHHHTETEKLKRSLRDQRQKYDQEKGALYIEMERIKRDHGEEVDRLQSDLDQAQESHQMYLKKLNEVIDYHEVLHEKETVTMNKIVEQVKKEKREEVTKLTRELEALKSCPKRSAAAAVETVVDDPDIQECIRYLTDESKAQKHRRTQFKDTMVALQSIASRTASGGSGSSKSAAPAGFSNRDLQDIDGLLDMLHHVYNVAENSHQKTLCMSHMLIEECNQMSETAMGFETMKNRLDCLEEQEEEEESAMRQYETQLILRQQEEVCGGNSFDELTKSMEASLYRGLGLI
mmetsp:Transcript_4149/g.9701  ORF Transcript_4149/g.9701 Transcript_4149/m.9701 type:complete len:705 (-) Transcript_4149:50-2164(-)